MTDLVALAVGLGLTWAAGIAVVAAIYRVAPPAQAVPRAWIVGCGWFAGMLVTTLLMRALSLAGIAFGVVAVGAPLAAIALAAAWLGLRGRTATLREAAGSFAASLVSPRLDGWQRLAWRLLIAWLALRFALLFAEVWWRPLYPWDAWTQWGTKARVWFEMRSMVPFAGIVEWMNAPAGAALWYDAAPHYPATMPLMQTWSALLVGRWDDTVVNLPWWLLALALGVGLYGGLVRLGASALVALGGAALVLTLPILEVHVALAGYADLPMAGFIALGTIAAILALRARHPGDGALAVLLLAGMVLVKNPGKAWVFMLLPAFLVAALPRHGLKLAAAMFGVAFLGLLVAARSGITLLGYHLTLQYAMPWGALFDAYFSFANWNLLWYAAVATVALAWRQVLSQEVAPFTVAVAGGLLFLFVGFAFTNAGAWVEDQSTVNRATLHLAPLVVVWMVVALRAHLREGRAATAVPAAAA